MGYKGTFHKSVRRNGVEVTAENGDDEKCKSDFEGRGGRYGVWGD